MRKKRSRSNENEIKKHLKQPIGQFTIRLFQQCQKFECAESETETECETETETESNRR